MNRYDVAIIGAGAAGMMCALEAGKRGRSVVLLEHNDAVGKKIRISGGGRCNFTNLAANPAHFQSANPHFCRSALARYTPADFVALVGRHGIAYHEKAAGQLFCDGSAEEINAMLLHECAAAQVVIRPGTRVDELAHHGAFTLRTTGGTFTASSLVIATGGLSLPAIGATDFGYRVARQFGLPITPLKPGLVPLTLQPAELAFFAPLSGVSLPVAVRCNGAEFHDAMLFTHRGLSGPAILQVSSFWEPGEGIEIDLLPDTDIGEVFHADPRSRAQITTLLDRVLPKRFVHAWCAYRAIQPRPLYQCSVKELRDLAGALHRWHFTPAGTEGYRKAEVTCGGIDTSALSSKTMEAHAVPGLYFIGEIVDVTGQLGGFNFQWAWASGFAAGQYV